MLVYRRCWGPISVDSPWRPSATEIKCNYTFNLCLWKSSDICIHTIKNKHCYTDSEFSTIIKLYLFLSITRNSSPKENLKIAAQKINNKNASQSTKACDSHFKMKFNLNAFSEDFWTLAFSLKSWDFLPHMPSLKVFLLRYWQDNLGNNFLNNLARDFS